jgi:hypothetical protein
VTPGRGREIARVVVVFAAIAAATTAPLIAHVASSLPAGLGDPALITFLLAWDADRIAHGFRNFWQAPFLFPHPDTLAYSEHMLGVAVFTAPLQWLTRNPVLAYNAAFLGSYVLAGVGMYLLARLLWERSDAAWLAGLAFMLSPYRTGQVTHLQVLMAGWMPLSLWALHRYLAGGSRRALVGFAASFLLLALSNGYYLFFFSLAVATVVAVELVRPRLPRRRILVELAAALLPAGALLSPFAWTYLRVQRLNAFERGVEDLFHYRARLADYVSVPSGSWTWGGLLPTGEPERQLYPGLFALGCALAGLATAFQRPAGAARDECRSAWIRSILTYVLVGLIALAVSFGPGAWRPYGLLLRLVPGFNGMRVPARAGIVVHMALVVLGAAGAARLLDRLPRSFALTATVTLGAVILVEGRGAPSVDPFPPVAHRLDRAAYEWLRESPPGAVIELRITQQNDFHPFTLFYQFNTLVHRHRIVNGYSGWPSVLQEFLGGPAAPFDDPAAIPDVLRALRAIGVRYLLLHEWTYSNEEQPARIAATIRAAAGQTVEERRFDRTLLWRLAEAEPVPAGPAAGSRKIDPGSLTVTASHAAERLPSLFDGNIETRWITGTRQTGSEWLEIRLQQPADICRLRIETSPRGLIDYPRRLVVESIDEHGFSRPLYEGSVLPQLIEALAIDDRHAPIDLELATNRTQVLRLRQTGRTHRWFWGVHELTLWQR